MDSPGDSPAAGPGGLPETEALFPRPPSGEELGRGASLGRYLILERLGAGGMGVVYAAYDPELDRKVAVKLLRGAQDPHGRARLLREAQALARLQHPNVIAVHDVGTWHGAVFMAMEFVPGRTLGVLLQEERPGPPRVLELFRQAGEGVAAAHAAGLVHRDFKPHNVLVGEDGRVRVLDFGLARAVVPAADETLEDTRELTALEKGSATAMTDEATVPEASVSPAILPGSGSRSGGSGGLLSTPLTRAGALLGTPAYMAPEQFEGLPADARSDQYSFCVALYTALYGEHPYSRGNLPELVLSARAGRVRAPAEGSRVAKWLRRVLLRGLQPKPEDRFADMRELLAALAQDPEARRRRWLLRGAAAALAASAVVGIVVHSRQQSQVCTGAEAQLRGIWDEGRKAAMRRAFLATGASFAAGSWRGAEAALDRYAGGWTAMRTEACAATRLRGEQSEELLDLRMSCLDQRREELRALGDLFARADAALVEKAVASASALSGLAECADRAALTSTVRPPRQPAKRAQVERLRARLARARVLREAGRYEQGLEVALPAVTAARSVGYRPLEGEALTLAGSLHNNAGDYEAAERELLEAVLAAEAGRDRETAALASSYLVHVVGYRLARFTDGHLWARHAAAGLEGKPVPGFVDAFLANQLGNLLHKEGRSDEAVAAQRRAVELYSAATGAESVDTALAINSLGNALRRRGEYEAARLQLRRALAIREKSLGPDHPLVGHSLHNLGTVEVTLGRYQEALPLYHRAMAIFERALGPENALVAITANNLSEVMMYLGRLEESQRYIERALAIDTKALGADHPDVGIDLSNLGEIQRRRDQPRRALESYTRALAIKERALGADHPSVAMTLTAIAETRLELGEARSALPLAERATALLTKSGEPIELAGARFVLAEVLWDSGGDRRRAVALARQAREGMVAAGEAGKRDLPDVDAWLARHGGS